ncbi:hypothetical protein PMAYCL1PPCAC_32752, partial [Pristionchus mayeri]
MERCIFCGWNRRTAPSNVRFFMIPREPGMKQLMWMHAIDKKCKAEGQQYEQCPRDRVCSVHFRQGRPSSDVTHEDFVPHLYLTSEPPAEVRAPYSSSVKVLNYLEDLADTKAVPEQPPKVVVKNEAVQGEYKAHVNPMNPNKIEVSKVSRPSILRRKRKFQQPPPAEEEQQAEAAEESAEQLEEDGVFIFLVEYPTTASGMFGGSDPDHRLAPQQQHGEDPPGQRRVRLQRMSSSVIETLGVRPGQMVVIKRRVRKVRSRASSI